MKDRSVSFNYCMEPYMKELCVPQANGGPQLHQEKKLILFSVLKKVCVVMQKEEARGFQ